MSANVSKCQQMSANVNECQLLLLYLYLLFHPVLEPLEPGSQAGPRVFLRLAPECLGQTGQVLAVEQNSAGAGSPGDKDPPSHFGSTPHLRVRFLSIPASSTRQPSSDRIRALQ